MFRSLSDLTKAAMFYGLAFAFCVVLALFAPALGPNTPWFAMFTPAAAVLVMMFVVSRDGYTRAGWAALGLHRTGWQAWGTALVAPLLVLAFGYGMLWATGLGQFSIPPEAGSLAMLPVQLLIQIATGTLLGGLGEEIGWRGYLLPRLASLGQGRAMLFSGFLHGVWHLPVLLFTPYYHSEGQPWIVVPLFLLTLTLAGAFYGYLRLTTNSMWPAAIAHQTYNTLWDLFGQVTVAASPVAVEYLAGESGLFPLAALAGVALWAGYRLRQQGQSIPVQGALPEGT